MTRLAHRIAFLAALAGLAALLAWGVLGIPGFGSFAGRYGRIMNEIAVSERRVTNTVTAVTYDYRALDTLGEEFILFAAVTGVVLLLRLARGAGREPDREPAHREIDELLRFSGPAIVAFTVLFGIYLTLHGQLTPGGGFQGGAIVATGVLLIFLTGGYSRFRRLAPRNAVEGLETIGAGGFAVVGLISIFMGGAFLQNLIPLGEVGQLLSGGMIPLVSLLVGFAVAGALSLLYIDFLEDAVQTTDREADADERGEET